MESRKVLNDEEAKAQQEAFKKHRAEGTVGGKMPKVEEKAEENAKHQAEADKEAKAKADKEAKAKKK